MGGATVAPKAVALLNRRRHPHFAFPDSAARAFTDMWRYSDNLRRLYETP